MEPALDLRDRSVGVVVLGCANRDGGPPCRAAILPAAVRCDGISKLAGRDACSCPGSSARGAIPRQWHFHQRYEYQALIPPNLILRIASWLNWRWAFVLIGSLGLGGLCSG